MSELNGGPIFNPSNGPPPPAPAYAQPPAQCADLGGGVQTINGRAVTCPTR